VPQLPANPCQPDTVLEPFQSNLTVPHARKVDPGHIHEINIGETHVDLAPGMRVPAWGYGAAGHAISSPGPLLEVAAGCPVVVRWKNRLPRSRLPGATPPELPFVTSLIDPTAPTTGPGNPQNNTGAEGGGPETDRLNGLAGSAGRASTCTARTRRRTPMAGRTTCPRRAVRSSPSTTIRTTTPTSASPRWARSSGITTTR